MAFRYVEFNICLPVSVHSFLYLLPFFNLAHLTSLCLVHWAVGPYYYNFLVNEGMGLILEIYILILFVLIVLYSLRCLPTTFIM